MERDWKAEYEKAQERARDLYEDLKLANAKLEGDPCTIGIYREMKIDRQRSALKTLNRRVRIQRLQLRMLNEMGRGITAEEWTKFKETHTAELDEIYDTELVSQ